MDGSLRVLDIQEKEVSTARPPSFPTPASAATGFPGPKKRTRFASAFKQQRQQAEAQAQTQRLVASSSQPPPPPHSTSSFAHHGADEKATIDLENRARLQDMGAGEIEAARQELLSNIDPSLLQILLRRANLDDASSAPLPGDEQARPQRKTEAHDDAPGAAARETPETKKRVLFASVKDVDENEDETQDRAENDQRATDYEANNDSALLGDGRTPPVHMAPILSPEAAIAGEPEHRHPHDPDHDNDQDHDHTDASTSSLHFPRGPSVPDLDPADPDFLEHLHAKYFPNLPADPARLAWMAPLPTADSPADRASPYYPGQDSVSVAQLRFDFRGRLVPPTAARTIPVSKGLHHHGEAPEAAGYTIGWRRCTRRRASRTGGATGAAGRTRSRRSGCTKRAAGKSGGRGGRGRSHFCH
ncbi:transcription factor [Niveomyces insectorum RCEF 264]|uniref:Transcription factor n=1 Tax=Niveomyces insectorum RCEF 264 TaxID=1081102 RepID=A0A167XQH5_9HYPO|nr:transcription factor [Niveomyces insectorum RCEF 264]